MTLRDPQQLTNGVGIRLMKAWSSDFSATSIPLMRCRLYGEVCWVNKKSRGPKLGLGHLLQDEASLNEIDYQHNH
jgi:hypothetical protein